MSVDLLIRAAAVLEIAVLAGVFIQVFGWTRSGVTGLVFLYGVIGYLTCPLAARHLASMLLQWPAFVACFGVGGFFWLFSRTLFDDGFRPGTGVVAEPKKLDLGQTITILANLGVIAGIVLLAIEMRQNNELLAAQDKSELSRQQAASSYASPFFFKRLG